MLMMFGDAEWAADYTEDDLASDIAAFSAFEEYLQSRDIPFSGEALHSASASSTVRHGPDGITVTDGPFVDLKEGIGGFYLIDVETMDDAIDIAKRLPSTLAVEVRPVYPTNS
jgi:hypothetical protein